MKAKVLILSKYNNCLGQMAQGWLKFFDKDLTVISGATETKKETNEEAKIVMKEVGIDISSQLCETSSQFMAEKWDYAIVINNCIDNTNPFYSENIKNRIYMDFEDVSDLMEEAEYTKDYFEHTREDVRNKIFDFYMRDMCGKDMLGSDSCGVECDLPDAFGF